MGLCGSAQGRVEGLGDTAGLDVVPKGEGSGNGSSSQDVGIERDGQGKAPSGETSEKSKKRGGSKVQPPSAEDLSKMEMKDVFLGFNVAYNELHLKKTIGRGSYGEVFECEFRGIKCACKKLHENGDQNESIYDFYHEISIMGNLQHPNILHFFGA